MPSSRIALAVALAATAALGAAQAEAATAQQPSSTRVSTAHAKPPIARIARPREGATVSGTVRPGLRVRGLGAVKRLELRVDGKLLDRWFPKTGTAPRWRTSSVADGEHVLTVSAVDASGTSRTSKVTVRVSNAKSRSKSAPRTPTSPTTPTSPVPTPAPPPSSTNGLDIPGVIMRTGDFNTGNLSQWSGHQSLRSYSLTTVSSPAREGGFAGRFEVRTGDDPLCAAGWGCYGDRSEVQMSTDESEGQERWYSWSTMFASDFPRYSAWQVVSQWHSDADGSPPVAFYAVDDELTLQFNRYSGPGAYLGTTTAWRGPLRRGQWQDIRMHVKWSGSDSVGYVELWINGAPQSFDNGQARRYIRTIYPGINNFFKQGLYRQGGLASTGIVYHDGFRMSRPA